MSKQKKWVSVLLRVLSYILVAAVAAAVTVFVVMWQTWQGQSKLEQLETVISECFIDEYDETAVEDAAAAAMVEALGNRWSYYIPASEYASHLESQENAYVGIGITISPRKDGTGFDIIRVEPTGGAAEAGIQTGDVLVEVGGKRISELGTDGAKELIRGEEGTTVILTVLRGEGELDFSVERRSIQVTVASGHLLEGNMGLVTIVNFNERCAEETIGVIEDLLDQGAESLVFDVRFNPGGYKEELVELLDYLLPKGNLFRSLDYNGREEVDTSDADCLEMPMAVLMNGDSYSAAEFFAAALDEYDWAVLVGEPTTGKSHFQYTIPLSDGSAVNLSVGKYFTPNGVSLADEGGLKPEVEVDVDDDTYTAIYYGNLSPEEDPQIQAAIKALQ